jgi:hypothetical protein
MGLCRLRPLTVSTPTIVPAGARRPIVKLLIVITMKLSTSLPADIEDQLGAEVEGLCRYDNIYQLYILSISHISNDDSLTRLPSPRKFQFKLLTLNIHR